VVDQDDPGMRPGGLPEHLDPFAQEEHHGAVVVLGAAVWARIEQVAHGIERDDIERLALDATYNGLGQLLGVVLIQDHSGTGADQKVLPRQGQLLRIQLETAQPLAQVGQLHLCLDVGDPQRARRLELEEGGSGG
jgi:hypothetical protein